AKVISAFDLVNNLPFEELSRILQTYGEERFHRRIARLIIEERRRFPIRTTQHLADIAARAQRRRTYGKIHPATRTFQAFRIAVNNELEVFERALDDCERFLNPGARVCTIAFHSLEDRIAKLAFKRLAKEGKMNVITKKPIRPTQQEMALNPRSRSAKLRVAERR
ncbi:MAG: 16S rRNA (cytosine(1402)-N(4))-methyltransferase RsmH, partial [Candidatus Omnitrophota bacterium]